jgi:hypothetical protein
LKHSVKKLIGADDTTRFVVTLIEEGDPDMEPDQRKYAFLREILDIAMPAGLLRTGSDPWRTMRVWWNGGAWMARFEPDEKY